MELSPEAIRVLGALMEKARTTPESYPLTLNSLQLACNQKTSRDPVTDFDEGDIERALDELRSQGLAMRVDMAGSRVAKFRENATHEWELAREEYALLAVLFLRGAQTPGQLRQRSDRLFPFAELQQVNDWLHRMEEREEEPHRLVQALGRAPGSKEIRWMHTLGGEVESVAPAPQPASSEAPASPPPPDTRDLAEKLDQMEKRLQHLESLLNELTS